MKKSYVMAKAGIKRVVELDENLVGQIGVRRFKQRDGSGREDWYWVANMMIEAKQNARRWSCSKHGDEEAYKQALAQRLEWERKKEDLKKSQAGQSPQKTSSPDSPVGGTGKGPSM